MSKSLVVKGSLSEIATRDNLSISQALLDVDAFVIVDTSGSMSERDAPGGRSRYRAACDELQGLQLDNPGKLAVVAFSSAVCFCPDGIPHNYGGGTDMAKALEFVFPYDATGVAFYLISDGEPDSESDTLRVARKFTSRIHTIYIGSERWGSHGREFLRDLALETGGTSATSEAPAMLREPVQVLLEAGA